MTQFITLAGQKQVGKDTSANMIKQLISPPWTCEEVQANPDGYLALKDNVHIVHFADALKKACNVIFGITLQHMETEEGKRELTLLRWPYKQIVAELNEYTVWEPDPNGAFMTVREVLQFVGTELFRNQLNPDVWLNSMFLKPWGEDAVVIIADARFPNEAALGRENGLLISIERDTGLASDGHKSENALADYTDYHYNINNNGSFDDLRE